nr:PREDICTED: breast cancer type 1 susceptibility protein [Latimeria chalumnae]|eukprot:XP_014352863.1 PREDICTED: breast cancer type 1 susceptibility protein [Latimeria chalumnae]
MALSKCSIEEVQRVLSMMHKNLECPVCLELLREPISTKCDHRFCRFCISKLLNKKKKGAAQCPLCKSEVTKSNVQESPRFKLLVEGLLKTIQAFEIDTGYACKYCKTVILVSWQEEQSKLQLPDTMVIKVSQRNKQQKLNNRVVPIYLEAGSDSSEELLFKKKTNAESHCIMNSKAIECEAHQEKVVERVEANCRNMKDDGDNTTCMVEAEELKVSTIVDHGFSDDDFASTFKRNGSFDGESGGEILSLTEDICGEDQCILDNNQEINASHENRDPVTNIGFSQSDGTSFITDANAWSIENGGKSKYSEMDKGQKYNLDESKGKLGVIKHLEEVNENYNVSSDLKETSFQKNEAQQKTFLNNPLTVSKKRLKNSIEKVSEWLLKTDRVHPFNEESLYEQDISLEFTTKEKENQLSEEESCTSYKTEIITLDISEKHDLSRSLIKQVPTNIEDQIFGKTYRREKKQNPHINWSVTSENKGITTSHLAKEFEIAKPSKLSLGKKNKRTLQLEPEDFIKTDLIKSKDQDKENLTEQINCLSNTNNETEKDKGVSHHVIERTDDMQDGTKSVSHPNEKVVTTREIEKSTESLKENREQEKSEIDKESTLQSKKVIKKRSKSDGMRSTKTTRALKLVSHEEFQNLGKTMADANFLESPNLTELQIDNYSSSEEPKRPEFEHKRTRRSRKLQLLAEETQKETSKSLQLCSNQPQEKSTLKGSEVPVVPPKKATSSKGPEAGAVVESQGLVQPDLQQAVNNQTEEVVEIAQRLSSSFDSHQPYSVMCSDEQDVQKDHNTGSQSTPPAVPNTESQRSTQNSASLLPVQSFSLVQQCREPKDHTELDQNTVDQTFLHTLPSENNSICTKNKMPESITNEVQLKEKRFSEVGGNTETEDSETDIQCLLKTFRSSKRKSFVLEPSPEQEYKDQGSTFTGEGLVRSKEMNNAESCAVKCASLGTEDHQQEVASVKKSVGSLGVSPQNDQVDACGQIDSVQYSDKSEVLPSLSGSNSSHELCVSPLEQTPCQLVGKQKRMTKNSKLQNKMENIGTRTSVTMIQECFNQGSCDWENVGRKDLHGMDLNFKKELNERKEVNVATVSNAFGHNAGSALTSHSESMLLFSATSQLSNTKTSQEMKGNCNQRKSEFLVKENKVVHNKSFATEKMKTSVEEEDEELVAKNIEEQMHKSSLKKTSSQSNLPKTQESSILAVGPSATKASQSCSETPDGLLASLEEKKGGYDSNEVEVSESPGKVKETTVVHCKVSENEKEEDRSSPNSGSQCFIQGKRRRQVQKLDPSESESESGDDEELPCFQALVSGKPISRTSASQESSTKIFSNKSKVQILSLPNSNNENDNVLDKKLLACSPRQENRSPSLSSEHSFDLFSSPPDLSGSLSCVPQNKTPTTSPKQKKGSNICPKDGKLENERPEKNIVLLDEQEEKLKEVLIQHTKLREMNTEHNPGEASGYESEASHTGDSSALSSQTEILNTQQKDAMQSDLQKLEHEMAVLEAFLEQGAQVSESSILQVQENECPQQRVPGKEDQSIEKGNGSAKVTIVEQAANNTLKISSNKHLMMLEDGCPETDCVHKAKLERECARSSTPPSIPSGSPMEENQTPEKVKATFDLLGKLKAKAIHQATKITCDGQDQAEEEVKQTSQNRHELGRENLMEKQEQLQHSITVTLDGICRKDVGLPKRQSPSQLPATKSPLQQLSGVMASPNVTQKQITDSNLKKAEHSKVMCSSISSTYSKGVNIMNAKSPVVVNQRKMSIVASGLNKNELLLVQRFARKTQSMLSSQITSGTTHVIMKTDAELVCERTLKYFLGIAGRKWVVSYQWITESFQQGRILDEYDFEVKGDVINGKNHEGPRRARQMSNDKLLLRGYEICCYGSFSDMSPDQLEWMLKLCGACAVKEPYLFSYSPNQTAVLVVQPDANSTTTDYRALQRKYNAMVVTREWILDSVACYRCQNLDAYLVYP